MLSKHQHGSSQAGYVLVRWKTTSLGRELGGNLTGKNAKEIV